jgi:hypothetical protein
MNLNKPVFNLSQNQSASQRTRPQTFLIKTFLKYLLVHLKNALTISSTKQLNSVQPEFFFILFHVLSVFKQPLYSQ